MVATTAGSSASCAVATETNYNLGPVKPQLTQLLNVLGPLFDIKTVGGYRESATNPNGHPAGLAADFMVPLSSAGRAQGDRLAAYAKAHARELGTDYLSGTSGSGPSPRIRGLAAHGGPRQRDREPPRPRPHQRQARDLPAARGPRRSGLRRGRLPVPSQYVAVESKLKKIKAELKTAVASREDLRV